MTAPLSPPAASDARWLLDELASARVVAADGLGAILDDFRATGGGVADAPALADFLTQGGLVTTFQVDAALCGKAASLAVGPYLLVEPVGSGSLGTVYRAVHTVTRQRFAVKLLPLRSLWNVLQAKRQVAAFARMPAATALVPIVEVGTAGGSHYLVWPFVEGETLESLVHRTGPLDPAHAVRFVAEALEGLAACHAAGIAHGLIKPSNLLLGPDRKARLLDLGIGAILRENLSDGESMMDTISTANVSIGMMDCTPPETLADPTVRTPAGDVYGLGCVLYFLLTGEYPFPDGNAVDKMIAHQTLEPLPAAVRNPRVPEGLSHLVEHLMRKSPADRPADLTLLVAALYEAVPAAAAVPAADLPRPRDAASARRSSRQSSAGGPAPGGSVAAVPDGETVSFEMLDPPETPRDSAVIRSSASARNPAPAPAAAAPKVAAPSGPVKQIVLQGRVGVPTPSPRVGMGPKADFALPPTSVQWGALPGGPTRSGLAPVVVPPAPKFYRSFWARLRALLTWQPPADVVQFSLFGPAQLAPGQTYRFHVYAHPPDSFSSVCTISRAFTADSDLLASGFAEQPMPRGGTVGLHLAVANAGVSRSVVNFAWVGQSKPSKFDVYVPWESPTGVIGGALSVGLDQVQVGRVEFEVVVLPRTS